MADHESGEDDAQEAETQPENPEEEQKVEQAPVSTEPQVGAPDLQGMERAVATFWGKDGWRMTGINNVSKNSYELSIRIR